MPTAALIHDWTRVEAGIWHDFHLAWIGEIRKQLNAGLLPDPYYALAEPQGGFSVEDRSEDDGTNGPEESDDPRPQRFEADLLTLSAEPGASTIGDAGVALLDRPPAIRLTTPLSRSRLLPRRIAIRHSTGDRTVALIDLVSPGNRSSVSKITSFCNKVVTAIDGGVHVLLIDLFPPNGLLPSGMHGEIAGTFGVDYDPPAGEPLTCAAYRAAANAATSFVEPLAVGAAPPTMPLFLTSHRYVELPLAPSYSEAFAPTAKKYRQILEAAA
ncbi:MAG: hypothetical protein AAF907_04515 [Planctomycetota bacterium]